MMRADSWTAEEEAWLREVYPDNLNSEIARMHAERFPDRPRRTAKAINSRGKVWGLRKAVGFDRYQVKRTLWTEDRVAWLKENGPGRTWEEVSRGFEEEFGFPLTKTQVKNARVNYGGKAGRPAGQFKRGTEPWNKGRTWDELGIPEESRERCRATQFKAGEVHLDPARERPIGFERIGKDGYIEVKVRDSRIDGIQRQEPGRFNENYRMKHHIVWEQANGRPVPEGHMVVFADRDKRNFDPGNLVAVPRSIWATISHQKLPYFDAESLRTCMAIAELQQAARKAGLGPRACRKCGTQFKPRYPTQKTCDACLGHEAAS